MDADLPPHWAATTGSLVGFEWWLERDRAMLLDHDRRVVGLSSQPFRASWPGATRVVSHTPDYFARLEDGSAVVFDVRPKERVGPQDAAKFLNFVALVNHLPVAVVLPTPAAASQPGTGSSSLIRAHSASLMSELYRGRRTGRSTTFPYL